MEHRGMIEPHVHQAKKTGHSQNDKMNFFVTRRPEISFRGYCKNINLMAMP
jgi:hypothetical protein